MVNSTAKNIKKQANNSKLQQVNPQVAGVDIGATMLMVCVGHADGTQEVQRFGTFTHDLRKIVQWCKACSISSIAMEATGVYWIPLYDILSQNEFEVNLVNPHHFKSLPGRKTDVIDCQWIQQLHSYGLLRGSFRPDDNGVALRTLVRHRTRLVELAASHITRAQKALVMMNIQLHQVVSDVAGVTGMQIIRAIVAGERNPQVLAQYRQPQCQRTEEEIALALDGNFRPEIIFTLKQSIEIYDLLQGKIAECEAEIKKQAASSLPPIEPPARASEQESPIPKELRKNESQHNTFDVADTLTEMLGVNITTIPGISSTNAIKIVAEIGSDMSRWATVNHFTSWLGLCPNNKISGGKILSSTTRTSANKAAQALRIAAFSLHRANNALGGYFRKLRARLGAPKALTALAHKIARILYTMIKSKQNYQELGLEAFERQYTERKVAALKKQAAAMGMAIVPA